MEPATTHKRKHGNGLCTFAWNSNLPTSISGTNVKISAGEFVSRSLALPVGSTATINWSVQSCDMNFTASFSPSRPGTPEIILVSTKRTGRGDHLLEPQPVDGVLRMKWDNGFSWFKAKQLTFKITDPRGVPSETRIDRCMKALEV